LALDDPVGMEDPESDEGVRYTGSGDGDGDGDGKTVAGASGVEKDDLGKAASAAQGPAVTAATAGSPAAAGAGVGPQLSAKRARLQYVGVPVFFHRTSFNSKFFPDCLNADKIKSHYCEVGWAWRGSGMICHMNILPRWHAICWVASFKDEGTITHLIS
jgi:hypothetical protein